MSQLLPVPTGTLGLRQSDALFHHTKALPLLFSALREGGELSGLPVAVGASTRPRAVDGSYMPCFLAGSTQAQVLATTLGIPFFPCSHQQGHLAAAAWSAGRVDLLDRPHLAWHLSGGTTELLLVTPDGPTVQAQCIGGTQDISAGQLIDRTGVLLGLDFPAGKALDTLYQEGTGAQMFHVKRKGFTFSLSGMENQVKALAAQGELPCMVARFLLDTLVSVICRTTEAALEEYPGLPVLFSGGVAANTALRQAMVKAVFAPPQYSADNALGVAILTHRAVEGGGNRG